ncbi:MAG: DUF6585 family protein [Planctomycetota bacterium]
MTYQIPKQKAHQPMAVFTEYDKHFPKIRPSTDLGDHRFSSFERMSEAIGLVAIGVALLAITAGVIFYGLQDRQRELLVMGGSLFALIFSVLVIVGLVNVFRARKQVHLFERGLVQTNHRGTILNQILFDEVTEFNMKHTFQAGGNQIDRYVCTVRAPEGTIRFSDYARQYQQERSQKLHQMMTYLQSRIPNDVKSSP